MNHYEFEALKRSRKMKCIECGKDMEVDDIDFNFDGCYDVYFICEDCSVSCIEEIRFGQSYQEHWHSETKGRVRIFTIKNKINTNKEKKNENK